MVKLNDSWGNKFDKNSEHYTVEHNHVDCDGVCGILYLNDCGPGTYFKQLDLTIKEKKGKYVLFSPVLLHEVKPFKYKQDRHVIVFNIGYFKKWEKYNQSIKIC